MNEIFETTTTKITHRIVKTKELEGTDFVYYEDIRNINEDGNSYIKQYKGITSKENIDICNLKGLDFIENTVKAPKMYEEIAKVAAINKNDFQNVLNGSMFIEDVVKHLKNIDDFMNKDKYILVLWNWLSYKIADLNYNFISTPISLDYINGGIDNKNYDLHKLLEKLKKDKNVLNRKDIKITNIPYYNCDYGSTETIKFKYLLPNDIYIKIEEMNLDYFLRYKYIVDEIIGAKECRKENDYEQMDFN